MKFDYISRLGEKLSLSHNDLFTLTNVDGMTAAEVSLSSSVLGGADGDTVTNAQVNPRIIVIDLIFKSGVNIEDAKRQILKIVKPKQKGSLQWEQNDRTVKIDGVVENIALPRFTSDTMMQISMHCESPFWEDILAVIHEINQFINLHYFTESPFDMLYFPEEGIPFGEYDIERSKSFMNEGDVAIGMDISVVALATATNPIIYVADGSFFGIGYGTGNHQVVMNAGDTVEISTHRGNKTIKLNGVNIYDKVKPLSTWLQLQTGENIFAINSDDESIDNLVFYLSYKQRFV